MEFIIFTCALSLAYNKTFLLVLLKLRIMHWFKTTSAPLTVTTVLSILSFKIIFSNETWCPLVTNIVPLIDVVKLPSSFISPTKLRFFSIVNLFCPKFIIVPAWNWITSPLLAFLYASEKSQTLLVPKLNTFLVFPTIKVAIVSLPIP